MARKTIFDDVFRTICQKMPRLLIPLINEVFMPSYPDDVEFEQLRNEHMKSSGKVITDSLLLIESALYHIECQSTDSNSMMLRMFEYDFEIALDEAYRNGRPYRMRFPESCVVYIRNGNETVRNEALIVELPDGRTFDYLPKHINIQDYTKEELFQKKLLMFLPFYILRYEGAIPSARREDSEKLEQFLEEFRYISEQLEKNITEEEQSDYYSNLIDLIIRISSHVVRSRAVRERMDKIMGGAVLELRSERDRRLGREEGMEEGRVVGREEGLVVGREEGRVEGKLNTIFLLIQDGTISLKKGSSILNIPSSELKEELIKNGYTLPSSK